MVTRQLPPTKQESTIARKSKHKLSQHAQENKPLMLQIADPDPTEMIELPAGVVAILLDVLEAMAAGKGITVIPENAELTTVQAAEILNVSRPFLIKLLEEGKIPYRKVGRHRRVRIEDVMRYKQAVDQEREKVLDQLVSDAQEQAMGYD